MIFKSMDWNLLLSLKRYASSHQSTDVRTNFQRDYDRIIFSSAFRRLQNKTQVFPLPGSQMVHNRLTHSLEVASVGRSIARMTSQKLIKLLLLLRHKPNLLKILTTLSAKDYTTH